MFKLSYDPPPEALPPISGMPLWLIRLLAGRGMRTTEEAWRFLHPALNQLNPPDMLHDLSKAASIIRDAVSVPDRRVGSFSKYAQCRVYGWIRKEIIPCHSLISLSQAFLKT